MKRHRALALAGATITFLVCAGVVWLVDAWMERRSTLASIELRLAELRGRRPDPGETDAIRQALMAEPDPQAGLLIAGEQEAAAQLEAKIRSIVQDHGAEILSLSLSAGHLGKDVPVVRGTLHLVISGESIGPFVKSLEAGPPTVFLDRFQVSYGPDLGSEQTMLTLNATLTVYRDVSVAERSLP